MDQTACIDLPAFPLQLLLRKHPDWRLHPAAVVEADTPQGTILWINEKARVAGIRTGMRYAAEEALQIGFLNRSSYYRYCLKNVILLCSTGRPQIVLPR